MPALVCQRLLKKETVGYGHPGVWSDHQTFWYNGTYNPSLVIFLKLLLQDTITVDTLQAH